MIPVQCHQCLCKGTWFVFDLVTTALQMLHGPCNKSNYITIRHCTLNIAQTVNYNMKVTSSHCGVVGKGG